MNVEPHVVFHEAVDAPLDPGTYEVKVSQKVKGAAAARSFDETFEETFELVVEAAPFALLPGYVQSRYPPPGAQGEYSGVLPHVVLDVQTLPWQRSAVPAADGARAYPWLALLSFDRDDPLPAVWHGTLDDLLPSGLPPRTVSYPGLALGAAERASDPCRFVDLPADLFSAIAPSLEELRWLAHGRRVEPDAIARKPFAAGTPPTQDLAVVTSNRLPAPGHETLCCLVSLEHMAALLPPSEVPADVVRLAVLDEWTFGSVGAGGSFEDTLTGLDHEPATLQVSPLGHEPKLVRDALAMGYAAFDHHTRGGARTVSWYRGPLLPFDNPRKGEPPFASADALVRYDPEHGMFDVTLAAAWQLGRLLALSDRSFATTLYDWKQGRLATAVVEFERRQLAQRLGLEAGVLSEPGVPAHVTIMGNVIGPLLQELLEGEAE